MLAIKNKNTFYILLTIAMLGWGASWVNVKVLSSYIDEYQMVFIRFIIAAISLVPVLLYFKKSFKIDRHSLLLALMAAVVNVLYMKFFFLGTKFGTAGLGGAFVTTMVPINTFIIMALFFGRKMSLKDVLALVIGAVGVSMILGVWTLHLDDVLTKYNLYFVLATLFWPILTIVSSRATKVNPMVFIFYMYSFSVLIVGLFFIDFSSFAHINVDSIFVLNMFSISILSTTFATSVYFVGIEKLGTNEVSSFIFLVPFFAIGLSYIFLDEDIGLHVLFGTALTILAVSMLNKVKIVRKNKT